MATLPALEIAKLTTTQADSNLSAIIEPLTPGYGVTIGNSLRRVLIASIQGSAITAIKVNNITHEFTTIEGVSEDVTNLILNLKEVRLRSESADNVELKLEVKGPKIVTAADFDKNSQITIGNPEHVIAHLSKGATLTITAIVEQGRGYIPVEQKNVSELSKGYIAIDSIFTPVKKVHFDVENTRVGEDTSFDKLTLDISTDGTITAASAFKQAADILCEHFGFISENIKIVEEGKKSSKIKTKASKKSK